MKKKKEILSKKKSNGIKRCVNGQVKNAILHRLKGRLSYNHKLLDKGWANHTITRPEMYDLGIEHAINIVSEAFLTCH